MAGVPRRESIERFRHENGALNVFLAMNIATSLLHSFQLGIKSDLSRKIPK